MKLFGIRLIPFVIGAALLWLLGWYQSNFHAPEGDLIRSSFLIVERHYPNPIPLPPVRDSAVRDILIVGDSHLDPSPKSRRFQNYLDIQVGSHSHWAYNNYDNPFSLGVKLSIQYSTRLLIFEVVERNLIRFARDFIQQDSLPEAETKYKNERNTKIGAHHLANGVRCATSLVGIRNHWCQNHQCRILPCITKCPLYSDEIILLTKDTWTRSPPKEVLPVLNELNQSLSEILSPQEIDFLIYVIPDKATVYNDFFECEDLPPSFLLEESLPAGIHSPIFEMRKAVHAGAREVYKYSDTHLAQAGAKITGEHINAVIQHWTESHPKLTITNPSNQEFISANALQQP